jgi:hypothetical protein
MIKTPKDLKPGECFFLSLRKNAKMFRVAPTSDAIAQVGGPAWTGSVPPHLKGKYLIILDDCRQLTLLPDQLIFT